MTKRNNVFVINLFWLKQIDLKYGKMFKKKKKNCMLVGKKKINLI